MLGSQTYFSMYYKTYADYNKAVDKILADADADKDLDDVEIHKIARTQEELGIGLWIAV